MFSLFFIRRPIVACVIAILIVIAGAVAFPTLPVAQYPEIAPPVIRVTTSFPGASAQVIADTVAAPIEQQVNGVDQMIYMESTSASDGSYTLKVSFELGTNADIASVLVQNRVNSALPQLPEEVKRVGVTTDKVSSNIITILSLAPSDPAPAPRLLPRPSPTSPCLPRCRSSDTTRPFQGTCGSQRAHRGRRRARRPSTRGCCR